MRKVERTAIKRRAKAVSTTTTTRIMNMSNLTSVKSILMAMQVSLKYADAVFSNSPGNKNRIKRIKLYISRLSALSDSMHTDRYIDPEIFYKELRLAAIAYVNLFYGATKVDRAAFMSSCMSDSFGKSVSPSNNIILLPSMLAENGVPIGKASFSILTGVHRKSFMTIKQAIKSSASIELFRNSAAMGSNGVINLDRLNKSIQEIDGMIENMHGLLKNYELVEAKKLELVNEMCEIGETSGFPVEALVESVTAPYGIRNFRTMRK